MAESCHLQLEIYLHLVQKTSMKSKLRKTCDVGCLSRVIVDSRDYPHPGIPQTQMESAVLKQCAWVPKGVFAKVPIVIYSGCCAFSPVKYHESLNLEGLLEGNIVT